MRQHCTVRADFDDRHAVVVVDAVVGRLRHVADGDADAKPGRFVAVCPPVHDRGLLHRDRCVERGTGRREYRHDTVAE